jgi:hypothetical protein
MKTPNLATIVLLASLSPSLVFAADAPTPETTPTVTTASDSANLDENWYWGMNLGVAAVRYKGNLETLTNAYKTSSNPSHAGGYFDIYFLWPLSNKKTAIGPSISTIHDRYESSITSDLTVTTTILGASIQHFFTSNIGEGLFGRVDLGVARAKLDNRLFSTSSPNTSDEEDGFGARFGIGYSLPLSNTTRMPFTVQWQHTSTEGDNKSNALSLTVGVMF